MIALLIAWKPLFVIIHVLSLIIGFGGANISDLLFFRYIKDFSFNEQEADTLGSIAHLILLALVAILISGFLLYLPSASSLNHNPGFLLKMTAVLVVTLNGILLHIYICPRLISISFALKSDQLLDFDFLKRTKRLNRIAFASGAVSVTSWYTAFLAAYLKPYVIEIPYHDLLLTYLGVLVIALISSQIMEYWFSRQGMRAAASKPVVPPDIKIA